jgi:hypothetical protein
MLFRKMASSSTTSIIMPRIIAICGAKRSGKDTLAHYISHKYLHTKLAFADPLKEAVNALFQFSAEQTGDSDLKDVIDKQWGITPRRALQFFGTEVLQYKIQELLPNIDRKFLANALVSRITKNDNEPYVISDMRFVHEYEAVKKLGAFVIRVDRSSVEENYYHDVPVHCSEIEYRNIPFDLHIKNDQDIATLIKNFEIGLHKHSKN